MRSRSSRCTPIGPDDGLYPTIHGLRGTGILLRHAAGDVDQIANDTGMSRQMVERYMRFRDQMEITSQVATRPWRRQLMDWTGNRSSLKSGYARPRISKTPFMICKKPIR
jgi:hypothetical protein